MRLPTTGLAPESTLAQRVAKIAECLDTGLPRHVPVSIFSSPLSPAEALVKHLKEQHQMSFAGIARLLNRDARGIWCTYQRAARKQPGPCIPAASPHKVPIALFQDRSLSILEHTVHYLRGNGLQVKVIAALVQKSPSTITTVHFRARRKLK